MKKKYGENWPSKVAKRIINENDATNLDDYFVLSYVFNINKIADEKMNEYWN